MKKYLFGIFAIGALTSCEDPISVEVDEGTIQLSVDAFLTNEPDKQQKIVLKETKQFFDNVSQNPFAADSVYVKDDLNNFYLFEDLNGNGEYVWNETDSSLVNLNRTYYLTIKAGELVYSSETTSERVATIDSINWEYAPPIFGGNGTYGTEAVIKDLTGATDYSWLRVKVNGEYNLNKGSQIIVTDNSNVGLSTDGEFFIPPAAYYFPGADDDSLGIGDEVTYELWSITQETSLFWEEVINQNVDGALGAIFATPTANVRTNILSSGTKLSEQAVGWFSTSMVNTATQEIFVKEGEQLSFPLN